VSPDSNQKTSVSSSRENMKSDNVSISRNGVKPNLALFLAVALISAAVLGYEVALTRVFAVLLRYQFAFLVISLALCGLGLGGLVAKAKRDLSLSGVAVFWGISASLSLLVILRGIFAFIPEHYWLAALVVLVPFSAAGTFLSLVFERYQADGGKLYGYDLAGAAIAAALCVGVMQFLGAIQACLLFAALGCLAGAMISEKKAFPLIISAILFVSLPYNAKLDLWSVQPVPPKFDENKLSLADRGITQPLYTELGDGSAGSRIVDTRWNAFARTDVVVDPGAPNSYLLYTNGNVPTNMLRWSGKDWELPRLASEFPLSDWTFANANLKDRTVLSIGPGGGLDALLALRYGAKSFEGAEINPSIVSLMDEPKYRKFNGGIYRRPNVKVVTAEGRAYVRDAKSKGKKYGLIFSALTKTATAGQGAALLESFIYTEDAFDDYVGALEDTGQLAIVGDAPPLLARLYATAISHFVDEGKTTAEAGRHVAVVFYQQPGPYQWALIVQKTPFNATQTAQMSKSANENQMFPLWIPGVAASDELFPFGSLGSGVLTLDGFIASGLRTGPQQNISLDLSPAPDDRPFVLDLAVSPLAIFNSSRSLTNLLGLSVVGTILFAVALLMSGRGQPANSKSSLTNLRSVIYFLSLGVGFMLVEIPLIQKLVLPLGYPTLSLTVILFSILLGGGAGALFSQRFEGEALREHALKCALGVTILAVVISLLLGPISNLLLPLPLLLRCILVAVLLMPLGFALGTPFPSGMRLFASSDNVPLVWALNGTASVVGSILSAVAAKMFGFSVVLTIGAVIYLGVAAMLFTSKKNVENA
jgi:hypothetical protein